MGKFHKGDVVVINGKSTIVRNTKMYYDLGAKSLDACYHSISSSSIRFSMLYDTYRVVNRMFDSLRNTWYYLLINPTSYKIGYHDYYTYVILEEDGIREPTNRKIEHWSDKYIKEVKKKSKKLTIKYQL